MVFAGERRVKRASHTQVFFLAILEACKALLVVSCWLAARFPKVSLAHSLTHSLTHLVLGVGTFFNVLRTFVEHFLHLLDVSGSGVGQGFDCVNGVLANFVLDGF